MRNANAVPTTGLLKENAINRQTAIRLACALIPIPTWRRKLRSHLERRYVRTADATPPSIAALFKKRMGYALDMSKPQSLNEKLQWIKFNGIISEMSLCADKVAVREHLVRLGHRALLNEVYGVWDTASQIAWDQLPDRFVLKTNHDPGGVWIVQDKANCDQKEIMKEIDLRLSTEFGRNLGEFHYQNIKPKVMAEALLEEPEGGLTDYKFHCFNGKCHEVMLACDRNNGVQYFFVDRSFKFLDYLVRDGANIPSVPTEKPQQLDQMFEIAEQLSDPFDFVRVDLYYIKGKIIFGELTFFPDSGFDYEFLRSTDLLFGSRLNLNAGTSAP